MNKRIFRKKNNRLKRPFFQNFSKILMWSDVYGLLKDKNYLNIGKIKIGQKK